MIFKIILYPVPNLKGAVKLPTVFLVVSSRDSLRNINP